MGGLKCNDYVESMMENPSDSQINRTCGGARYIHVFKYLNYLHRYTCMDIHIYLY